MKRPVLLLCGGTGALGGAIAVRLHDRGVPFRAMVRPGTDADDLEGLASEIVRADFRDPASLPPALAGIVTVVSTVNAIGRLLGRRATSPSATWTTVAMRTSPAAAEAAGMERFVYVSMLGDHAAAHTPFTDAKAATERRLRESPLREFAIRPDAFQEVWLGPAGGFDLAAGKVRIYGKGVARRRHVAIDDVAEAVVRLALADDPPRTIDLAGPEPMSASEAAVAYEHALGRPLKVSHVPRIVMRAGRTLMRPIKPEVASIMGMALASDLAATQVADEGFRGLGVEPRAASTFIAEVAAVRA